MKALGRNMHETNNVIRLVKTKFSPLGLRECSVMLCTILTTFKNVIRDPKISLQLARYMPSILSSCVNIILGLIAWKGEQTTL